MIIFQKQSRRKSMRQSDALERAIEVLSAGRIYPHLDDGGAVRALKLLKKRVDADVARAKEFYKEQRRNG